MMKRMMTNTESYHLKGCAVLCCCVPVAELQLGIPSLAVQQA